MLDHRNILDPPLNIIRIPYKIFLEHPYSSKNKHTKYINTTLKTVENFWNILETPLIHHLSTLQSVYHLSN